MTIKSALMMVCCSVTGIVAAGAVSAAPAQVDAPQLVVHYSHSNLESDVGARTLYRRLVSASEKVCPDPSSESRLVSSAIQQCRAESLARAVRKINDPRLVAVYSSSRNSG